MQRLVAAWKARRRERLLLVVPILEDQASRSNSTAGPGAGTRRGPSQESPLPVGAGIFVDDGAVFGVHGAGAEALGARAATLLRTQGSQLLGRSEHEHSHVELFLLEQSVQPRILLLGAGADALPVAKLALFLGWSVTVVDHRSHYAVSERFPGADAVLGGGPAAVSALLYDGGAAAGQFDAAIVMSHHLLTDAAYLRALVLSNVPYVGLLGPALRRERLLAEIGVEAARLRGRLRAPIGLDLGANSPESIALAIIAEIQAVLSGTATFAPMSARVGSPGAADARSAKDR
jgi:xanthine/CO dehydrogenase XdhC/CoxF family maturation factor